MLRISQAGCRGTSASRLHRVYSALGSGERRVCSLSLASAVWCISKRGLGGFMHAPAAARRKPPSTWGNATGVALHNVHYRTPAWPRASASGENLAVRSHASWRILTGVAIAQPRKLPSGSTAKVPSRNTAVGWNPMRIQQLDLWNYKAFERFTMTLGANAFLVGPNNAGKSTLIEAARVAAGMLEHASRRRATGFREHGHRLARTHSLRADQYGLVTENLRHQFRLVESAVSIRTDTNLILTGVWPSDDDDSPEPFFYLRHPDDRSISEPREVRELTGQIGVIRASTH